MTVEDIADKPAAVKRLEAAFLSVIQHPRLGLGLAALALVLSSPVLAFGFYLDDYVGRYVYSTLPGAERLRDILSGGYGIANGVPSDTHWQIEQGFAPWWTDEHLLGALFRPIGMAGHFLDVRLWPDSPLLMRLHSFAWLAVLVLVVTRLYRSVHGLGVGGFAALLVAVDYTHGFSVGYITNRHALISGVFAVACLHQHIRSRTRGGYWSIVLAAGFYLLGLLSSEATISVLAYLLGYAFFVDDASLGRRVASFLPYVGITLVWRIAYAAAGYGFRGSGLYIDPATEPLGFLAHFLERGPVLLGGLLIGPPAELYVILPERYRPILLGLALVVIVLAILAFGPLIARNPKARMWAFGAAGSLVPAGATYPHDRQLLLASIGAMALLAQVWELHAFELRTKLSALWVWSRLAAIPILGWHLFVSPFLLPFATCSSALVAPLHRAITTVGDEVAGRTAVFVSSPDYFAVKLVLLSRLIEREPIPRRTRALSFGPVSLDVERTDAHTLTIDYRNGILGTPFLELYRDRRNRMHVGDRVELAGLSVEVLSVTDDGRAQRVRFAFARRLDEPAFRFYVWKDGGYEPWKPPPVGHRKSVPPATLRYGLGTSREGSS